MNVKRNVKVCDYCYDVDDDEFTVAKNKCKICNKDLCDSCSNEYYLSFGDEDDESRIMDIDCCIECIKSFQIKPKKDKKFTDDISKQVINYFKQKVMLKEIEK